MDENFENYVSDALDHIPNVYTDRMQSVAVLVDDYPSQEQRAKLGLRKCDALFGLYEGVPLTNRNGSVISKEPDKITIFKYPMIEMFPKQNDLKKQIYETLWHEVAHYFGLNHQQIHKAKNNKHS